MIVPCKTLTGLDLAAENRAKANALLKPTKQVKIGKQTIDEKVLFHSSAI
jgi:hypothetical protein